MNLGQKIKKYRKLKGLTQHELGKKLGFAPKTAFTRIQKYEQNLMAPKNDIRNRMAEILDVDISALSDNDYSSDIEIVRALFFMQEKYGVEVRKETNGIAVVFNNENCKSNQLMSYLNEWYEITSSINDSVEYEKWKAKFPQNV